MENLRNLESPFILCIQIDIYFLANTSYDCIRGLASLVESRRDLAGDVSIQKIERSLKEAVRFDAADVLAAVEQNVELR